MKLSIQHHTTYHYEALQRHTLQLLRLMPLDDSHQKIVRWDVEAPGRTHIFADAYGNRTLRLEVTQPHQYLHIRVQGEVETGPSQDQLPGPLDARVFLRFTRLTTPSSAMDALMADLPTQPTPQAVQTLAQRILAAMPFQVGITTASSTAAEALALGAGVCQDHTHVMLTVVRMLGWPARYVSGYLFDPDRSGPGVASHSWADIWMGQNWYSFDVSNAVAVGEMHLKLATGCDYLDACPVRGVRQGDGQESMQVRVSISPISGQQTSASMESVPVANQAQRETPAPARAVNQ